MKGKFIKMLIDCHAHIDEYRGTELRKALNQISERKILTMSVAMDVPSYRRAVKVASRTAYIVPAFGVHPWNAPQFSGDLVEMKELTIRTPMIGEIGLDHHFIEDKSQYPKQQKVFEFFLREAVDQNKAVNVHTKGAEADVLTAVKEYRPPRVIVHWYSGPMNILEKFIETGAYFTVGVQIGRSEKIRELARRIPVGRLLTETDGPGAARHLGGLEGMPADLEDVIEHLAAVRNVNRETMERTVRENFLGLVDNDPYLSSCEEVIKWRSE
ncbi:MAG: TatD family hydrolase [Candidatus Aminicenantes bacterium]|nr:TatD family hydrolase [Candidatus Aminicenantes bacterium]